MSTLPVNEPILAYLNGSTERKSLIDAITRMKNEYREIPMIINGKEVHGSNKITLHPPHEIQHTLGHFYEGSEKDVHQAIQSALLAQKNWMHTSWEERKKIFLKAADLISGKYRAEINAATMLGQSKNVFQAEIDSACELADFLRFNVYYTDQIYAIQPFSPSGFQNELHYRPLEGFVFALTPFNFTAIAGNLPSAPAMLGNVVVWKPAYTQIYSAHVVMKIFMEAGLPAGVINLIFTDGPMTGSIIFSHPQFAGLHFTGSTQVFTHIWKQIGNHLDAYKNFPKIVGETGGKDFVLAHPSADLKTLSIALIRGAYEFQGQKCSAASRAYIPESIWPTLQSMLLDEMSKIKMGSVEDFGNLVNAVIDEKAFNKINSYIENASKHSDATILAGGKGNSKEGYFIPPTLIQAHKPDYTTMREEIFGPVLTVYVYKDNAFNETLQLVDRSTDYALTGSIFAQDEKVIAEVRKSLIYAAGNFYINDKPTGAVVNQQPFGGARKSGTNDKAGAIFNMMRWISPQTIKRTMHAPTEVAYPYMK